MFLSSPRAPAQAASSNKLVLFLPTCSLDCRTFPARMLHTEFAVATTSVVGVFHTEPAVRGFPTSNYHHCFGGVNARVP